MRAKCAWSILGGGDSLPFATICRMLAELLARSAKTSPGFFLFGAAGKPEVDAGFAIHFCGRGKVKLDHGNPRGDDRPSHKAATRRQQVVLGTDTGGRPSLKMMVTRFGRGREGAEG